MLESILNSNRFQLFLEVWNFTRTWGNEVQMFYEIKRNLKY